MARGRRGGGMGARKPAARPSPPPSRPASTRATPAPTASTTPAPVQQSSGGGMLSGIGSTIAQGMAFGTGSAIAHQAVGAAVGAMSGGSSSSGHDQAAPQQQQQQMAAPVDGGVCGNDKQLFFDCLKSNNGDAQACSFLYEQLQNCQQQSSQQTFY